MATYAQLKKQIEQLAKKAEAALRAEKNEVLAKVRDAVSSFSLTAEEVFGTKSKKAKSAKPATAKRAPKGAGQVKYADPKTGATWSGFGRAPAWLASAKDRTEFLVDQSAAVAAPAKSKAVKSAAKPKAAKATATKKAAKAPVATPAKKSAQAVAAAPTKKVAKAPAKVKAASTGKKVASAAPKKAVSKAAAPAKKAVSPKAKAKVSAPPSTAPAAAPAVNAQA